MWGRGRLQTLSCCEILRGLHLEVRIQMVKGCEMRYPVADETWWRFDGEKWGKFGTDYDNLRILHCGRPCDAKCCEMLLCGMCAVKFGVKW